MRTWLATGLILLTAAGTASGAERAPKVRKPIAAGAFYPDDAATLRADVERYLEQADVPSIPGRIVGCVAPQGKYEVCGEVAAHAFKPLKQGQYDRVLVLAPSNYVRFRGCSIAAVDYYRTPLGLVPVDKEAVRRLSLLPFVNVRSVVYRESAYANPNVNRVPLHEKEHGIEVVLPFLQVKLGEFELVPVVMGEFEDYHKERDWNALEKLLAVLREIVDDRTLIVVCSDFTRYGVAYDFTPFRDDIPQNIAALDLRAFPLIQACDTEGFEAYLAETENQVSGKIPLLSFMALARGWARGVLLRYDTSGRVTNDWSKSVSFASLCFFEPPRERARGETR